MLTEKELNGISGVVGGVFLFCLIMLFLLACLPHRSFAHESHKQITHRFSHTPHLSPPRATTVSQYKRVQCVYKCAQNFYTSNFVQNLNVGLEM